MIDRPEYVKRILTYMDTPLVKILSLMADYDVDIYVTGSNSRMMSSEISTYLTGRPHRCSEQSAPNPSPTKNECPHSLSLLQGHSRRVN